MAADEATLIPSGLNSEPFYATYQWNIRNINADKTAAAGYLAANPARRRLRRERMKELDE